ncbi:MAG: phenylalanine--tRNA ligase subunit beta-related protein, partial [Minisyncoccota bacterium]
PYVIEINFDNYIETLPDPVVYEKLLKQQVDVTYKTVSAYPFMLRDIALWTPEGVESDEVRGIIMHEGGDLLRVVRLFDVFTKEFPEGKKTSYAFNLVFQSYEKTLSDDEVNVVMERITRALVSKGYEVR